MSLFLWQSSFISSCVYSPLQTFKFIPIFVSLPMAFTFHLFLCIFTFANLQMYMNFCLSSYSIHFSSLIVYIHLSKPPNSYPFRLSSYCFHLSSTQMYIYFYHLSYCFHLNHPFYKPVNLLRPNPAPSPFPSVAALGHSSQPPVQGSQDLVCHKELRH